MNDVVAEGRSYHVVAPTKDLARPVARRMAQKAGQSNWATASVLWIEVIGVTLLPVGDEVLGYPIYEVVLEAPAPTPTRRQRLARHVRRADRVQTP